MTGILGPAEIKQEYVDATNPELGELLHDLWNELTSLHMYWGEYVELFGHGPERVDLLNQSASGFFWMAQNMMWERTIIHITRLLDAKKAGKQARATLKALPEMVDPNLKSDVERQLNVIAKSAVFCWDWRDRYLAHRDLDLALERAANPLRGGSREDLGKILEGMADLLNLIREHYKMSSLVFDIPSPYNGAQKLLRILQLGLMMKRRRDAQWERGEEPEGGYILPSV